MFSTLFKKNTRSDVPKRLYNQILLQARQPEFFLAYGFEDDVMGRFDLLSLHVMMLCRRLGKSGAQHSRELSQEIFDAYVADIEVALRTLGIGDTSVPKKKKKMVRSFYGMIEDLEEPLENENLERLSSRIAARFFADSSRGKPDKLSGYLLETVKHLDQWPVKEIFKGEVRWLSVGSSQ